MTSATLPGVIENKIIELANKLKINYENDFIKIIIGGK